MNTTDNPTIIPPPTADDLEQDLAWLFDNWGCDKDTECTYAVLIRRCAAAESRAAAAEKFKAWVHAWLDGVGVPHDPDPEHTAEHGCRISGRMRYLLNRATTAEAERNALAEANQHYAADLLAASHDATVARARIAELEAENRSLREGTP